RQLSVRMSVPSANTDSTCVPCFSYLPPLFPILWRVSGLEYRPVLLIRLDVCRADHLAPLLDTFGDELAEIGRRPRQHRASEIGKSRLDLGIGKGRIDFFVEPIDDFGRRVPGRANTAP